MTAKIVLVINSNGVMEYTEITNATAYNVVSDAVGGWVERVAFRNPDLTLWVNEEGKLLGLPQNPKATALWKHFYGNTDVIVGNVVITGMEDSRGNTKGLSQKQLDFLQTVVGLPPVLTLA